MALPLRHGVAVLALEVAGDGFVKFVLLLAGGERAGEQAALGVFDILKDLAAEHAVAEGGKPLSQGSQVAAGVCELGAEGWEVAEEAIIDQGGQAVEFDERVLERGGGEEDFLAAFGGAPDRLTEAVALAVAVPELVGLIHHDEVPRNRLDHPGHAGGVVIRADNDLVLLEGRGVAVPLKPAEGVGIEADGRLNFSSSSKAHCFRREAGVMTSSLRRFSAQDWQRTSPASIVLPRPTSSASKTPLESGDRSANMAASIWWGLSSTVASKSARPKRSTPSPPVRLSSWA